MPTIADLVRAAYSHWDDAAVLARTGRELHDRNRLDRAQEVLARALELDASDPDTWAHLGYACLRGYQPDKGFEVLREGVERTGSDQLRATLAGFTSDEEERKSLLAQLADSDEPGVRAATASVRLWGGDEGAFDELRRLQDEHPDDSHVRQTWLWTLLNARHRGMARDIDLREAAVPLTDKKIEERPDRISGHWMKAQLLLAEQDWNALLAATGAALERFPDEETMMFLRGRAFKEKGDQDRAAECFARAIGMKPSFAGARAELGKVYEAQGKLALAESVFREIPRVNPDYAGGPVSLALFLARRERWDEAESQLLETWSRLQPWQKTRLKEQPDAAPLLERERVKAVLDADV
ncbi:MAG: tetratricopeptide repeat protein [Planctomycetota bacterium]|jgi:Flp pilus assembly protein TadD